MIALDSPWWRDDRRTARVGELVRTIATTRELGGWRELFESIVHQGSVYPATYAALPHVLALAEQFPADVWIDVGFVASAIARSRVPVASELGAPCTAALERAIPAVVACVLRADVDASAASYLALAAIAIAGHRVGRLMWAFLEPPKPGAPWVEQQLCRAQCAACDAELEWMHAPDGIVEYRAIDAPAQPPIVAPPIPELVPCASPWSSVAARLERVATPADQLAVARVVAAAGVPASASDRDVVCLASALIAALGHVDWASRFARLASFMRCTECDELSAFVACLPELAR